MKEPLPEELLPLLSEELREQLSVLSAAVQVLSPLVQEREEPRYDDCLSILNRSLYRMIRTLNNLDFAQLPEGEAILREENLDLAALCRGLLRESGALAAMAGVTLRPELEGPPALLTRGDSELLRRMIFQMLSNALRAAGEGGQAGICLSQKRGCAVITVWDDGPGLTPPADFPADSLIPRPEGLGLGLPVARRIARLHGGVLMLGQRGEERGMQAVASLPIRPLETGMSLKAPKGDRQGGFHSALLELSSVLPYQAFAPRDLE